MQNHKQLIDYALLDALQLQLFIMQIITQKFAGLLLIARLDIMGKTQLNYVLKVVHWTK